MSLLITLWWLLKGLLSMKSEELWESRLTGDNVLEHTTLGSVLKLPMTH